MTKVYNYKNALNLNIKIEEFEKVFEIYKKHSGQDGEKKFFENIGYELEEIVEDNEATNDTVEYSLAFHDKDTLTDSVIVFECNIKQTCLNDWDITITLKDVVENIMPMDSSI